MRTALRRLLQGLLVLALIPFLLDVPAGADASAESLLATGAAPNATVVSVEGRRTVVATAGRSSDPALVLIHGFGGSTFGWRHVMEPLAASGWYVVALDLPGFGLAEKGWGGAYDHASHARFVLAAMDQMQINQAVLAGHSMGGNVVSWVAALAPERIRALALIDAAIVSPTVTPSSAASTALSLPPLRRATRILIRSAFTEATFGELLSSAFAVKSAATPEMIRGYAAASRLPEWDAALLGVLRDGSKNALTQPIAEIVSRAGAPIPTLILWGADDSWVPLSAGESLRDALPAATYVVLPGLGHVPFEEDPEVFTRAMQEWLAALK
ncbi:MAG: alpha/beta hydrolase [Chloroflexi bacterium]|nr:alpha/beta hydrolase [Chloroflexota bacterium]